MPTTEKRSLHAKLAEVMAEAETIPKNGTAPAALGSFKFVQVGDAAKAIREALGKRHISMLPTAVEIIGQSEHETRSGGTMTTVEIRTTWTLTDGESGESVTIQSYGAGADAGDKYSGKAQTNAMKYALLMGFLLSTGDDPEQADTSDRQAKPGEETLELVGEINRSGTVKKGDGRHSNLEAHETPDGHHIGFRLEVASESAIPQVCAEGAIGRALFLAIGEDTSKFVGKRAHVWGRLYQVKQSGRRSVYRLILTKIKTDDFVVPAEEPEHPVDAPPADFGQQTIAPGQEALPLTDEEKELIAGGLPGSLA